MRSLTTSLGSTKRPRSYAAAVNVPVTGTVLVEDCQRELRQQTCLSAGLHIRPSGLAAARLQPDRSTPWMDSRVIRRAQQDLTYQHLILLICLSHSHIKPHTHTQRSF